MLEVSTSGGASVMSAAKRAKVSAANGGSGGSSAHPTQVVSLREFAAATGLVRGGDMFFQQLLLVSVVNVSEKSECDAATGKSQEKSVPAAPPSNAAASTSLAPASANASDIRQTCTTLAIRFGVEARQALARIRLAASGAWELVSGVTTATTSELDSAQEAASSSCAASMNNAVLRAVAAQVQAKTLSLQDMATDKLAMLLRRINEQLGALDTGSPESTTNTTPSIAVAAVVDPGHDLLKQTQTILKAIPESTLVQGAAREQLVNVARVLMNIAGTLGDGNAGIPRSTQDALSDTFGHVMKLLPQEGGAAADFGIDTRIQQMLQQLDDPREACVHSMPWQTRLGTLMKMGVHIKEHRRLHVVEEWIASHHRAWPLVARMLHRIIHQATPQRHHHHHRPQLPLTT
ncbi:hypothetical protein PTSG_07116 [Salpingoeca rosetta]|uniref:Uncharacterized protein n=1 Tax=Salpingoeca rosetta (strain ATCC 50818 / BSB-021) TaxID=946362 RepID=F2UE38_SALR5|nr:uncharacterized protein PTSG_07116 [Salpingoeca rosetta]EGD74888.1 hypothetical protein PTSG_07116 [Salpingoeca rosetta]|eukprot:XP_004992533.1 hypothetical protein PTSG_07116 [Salpingoeca rosetta]